MKMKKIFKIIGIIILSLLLITLIYFTILHFNGILKKDNTMTREEVVTLLKKGEECSNYYYSSEEYILFKKVNEIKTEYYIKDGVIKCVSNGNILRWENYNTDEVISIMGKNAGVSSLKSYYNYGDETVLYNQKGFDYSIIADEKTFNTNFEYLGEKQYNGRITILVQVWNKDNTKVNPTIFYIDKDTGLIMKRIDYSAMGLIKLDCNRNVKLDVVTDKDVERPNLDNYEVLNSEK